MLGGAVFSEATVEGRLAAKARLPLPKASIIDFIADRLSMRRCYRAWHGATITCEVMFNYREANKIRGWETQRHRLGCRFGPGGKFAA